MEPNNSTIIIDKFEGCICCLIKREPCVSDEKKTQEYMMICEDGKDVIFTQEFYENLIEPAADDDQKCKLKLDELVIRVLSLLLEGAEYENVYVETDVPYAEKKFLMVGATVKKYDKMKSIFKWAKVPIVNV